MKYPTENDSYYTWLKHCCKVFGASWSRTDEIVDTFKDILDKGIDIFVSICNLIMLLFGPLLLVFAPLVAYYARKSYIKRRQHMNKLEDDTIKSYRSNYIVKD